MDGVRLPQRRRLGTVFKLRPVAKEFLPRAAERAFHDEKQNDGWNCQADCAEG